MFSKVLIANRGEIAVRIIRTCRDLGIGTVAVYSDADRENLHVRLADEAYRIGPPPAAESYLRIDRILEIAERAGVEAIHPGYGFLAENDEFARASVAANRVFIGPPAEAVRAMGDKAEARARAARAGVPVVPGTEPLEDEKEALRHAKRLGAPLLVKATAGGGGKGMRLVQSLEELPSAFRQARSEASSSFGDPSLYLEKYIERPRHIEFQIVADSEGQVVHLLERECSIQRRHQKLVEEAPSAFVDEDLRERMGQAACALAREAGYRNAGTVEFLVDAEGRFYFLEVNARLQVEHPVTELVTGVDLVRLQLELASGRRLPFRQEDVEKRGWAIEFRITAEDPFQNFVPSGGRLAVWRPAEGPGVRNDTGVFQGFEVTPHYDPMIAKLIVGGADRKHCLARARRAIGEYRVHGIATTLPFFERLLRDERFVSNRIDVGFVDRHWMAELAGVEPDGPEPALAAALAAAGAAAGERRELGDSRRSSVASAWKQAGLIEQVRGRL